MFGEVGWLGLGLGLFEFGGVAVRIVLLQEAG